MAKRKPKRNNPIVTRIVIRSKDGEIDIKSSSIVITGTLEAAALALAEDILKKFPNNMQWPPNDDWATATYASAFYARKYKKDNIYQLGLLNGDAISEDIWIALKKGVEKICNNLTAFM